MGWTFFSLHWLQREPGWRAPTWMLHCWCLLSSTSLSTVFIRWLTAAPVTASRCYAQFTTHTAAARITDGGSPKLYCHAEKTHPAVSRTPVPQDCSFWCHQPNLLVITKYSLEILPVLIGRVWTNDCLPRRVGRRISFTRCSRSLQLR